jgi:hypothetical protein
MPSVWYSLVSEYRFIAVDVVVSEWQCTDQSDRSPTYVSQSPTSYMYVGRPRRLHATRLDFYSNIMNTTP